MSKFGIKIWYIEGVYRIEGSNLAKWLHRKLFYLVDIEHDTEFEKETLGLLDE